MFSHITRYALRIHHHIRRAALWDGPYEDFVFLSQVVHRCRTIRRLRTLGCPLGDFDDRFAGLDQRRNGQVFIAAVEVGAASEQVRARQAAERELGPVRTAADRSDLRRDADCFHGFFGQVDDIHMAVFDFFQHIIIDIMRRDDNGPIAVFFIEEISHLLQQGLAPFKTLAVVVADEHVHRARFDVAIQFIDVEEAFMAFGVFRFFPGRQELLPLCGNRQCVDHLSFGVACMDAAAMEGDDRVGSIEVFIFQTAQFAAVDSIGKSAANCFTSNKAALRPVSSSGVKPMRIVP